MQLNKVLQQILLSLDSMQQFATFERKPFISVVGRMHAF